MFTTALLSLMLVSPAASGPLSPALTGQLLCMSPDPDQKTCMQIDRFKATPDGTFINVSDMRIAVADGSISYTLTTSAVVKGEEICTTLQRKHLQAARFRVTGLPLTPAQSAELRRAIEGTLTGYLNKESCMAFDDTPEGLVARARLNGIPDTGLDVFVKWVDPAEGYHLVR